MPKSPISDKFLFANSLNAPCTMYIHNSKCLHDKRDFSNVAFVCWPTMMQEVEEAAVVVEEEAYQIFSGHLKMC